MVRKSMMLAVAAGLLSFASAANAVISVGYWAVYYSDETHTTAVGEGTFGCGNNDVWMSWGVRTTHYVRLEEFSCKLDDYDSIR